ncbi:uncharacterized protein LOC143893696 [Temnothorax americanus]|uniref:uncharacterized protein LOC143893696 n=1 Tax=Temnothorax americanus TaxID=1964332 RepID=UPI0040695EAF
MSKIEKNRETQVVNEENEENVTWPFHTDEQLLEFERKLKNPIFFQKMSSSFKMIGGDKVNLATNAILSRLIADTFAKKYSWHEQKGKKVFAQFLTAKLFIKAALIWLAQATTREKRLQAKRQLEPQEQIVLEDEAQEDNMEN